MIFAAVREGVVTVLAVPYAATKTPPCLTINNGSNKTSLPKINCFQNPNNKKHLVNASIHS